MTITLTPDQEQAIQDAIRAGLVQSVDEFIGKAIEAPPHGGGEFDAEKARQAGERIREIRRGVSIRELAHIGHKY
jgi:Arc/MetJ-type ribon-helix-helix transcriptional regulator